MVGWHHQRNGHEFEQAPGVGDGQGSLACCSPCDRRESDKTELSSCPGGSVVKNPPANARDLGLIPGLERSPRGGMATHSSFLAWETPWAEEPSGPQYMRSQRIRYV